MPYRYQIWRIWPDWPLSPRTDRAEGYEGMFKFKQGMGVWEGQREMLESDISLTIQMSGV